MAYYAARILTACEASQSLGVRGLLVQKTGLSARELAEVRSLQRPVFAAADEFGEDLRGCVAEKTRIWRIRGLARGRGRDLHWWQRVLRAELRASTVPLPVGAPVACDRRDHRRTRSRDDWAVPRERHRTSCQWLSVSPYWRPRNSPLGAIVSPHG
jgi:hypothetical protein